MRELKTKQTIKTKEKIMDDGTNKLSNLQIGDTCLITTDGWFSAPDGNIYRAVFGTIKGITTDKETLGVDTNRHSTNWYVEIGNMTIAGCQIHYAIKTRKVSDKKHVRDVEHEGKVIQQEESVSRIYMADKEWG